MESQRLEKVGKVDYSIDPSSVIIYYLVTNINTKHISFLAPKRILPSYDDL